MNNFNHLNFLHINCRSLSDYTKIYQIEKLAQDLDIHIISLNETFLKPNKNVVLTNFNLIRADRKSGRGGGAALAIKNNIKGQAIKLNESEEVVGFEIVVKDDHPLAIFSAYSSPKSSIDNNFFEFVSGKYKNILILGDLNAHSPRWYCEKANAKGIVLDTLLDKLNLFVINDNNPTYCRSNNVLDLAICSSNLVKLFTSFKVLKNEISDHWPIFTRLTNVQTERSKSTISKIDWQKFKSILSTNNVEPNQITNRESLNHEVNQLTNTIKNALSESKVSFSIINKNKPIVTIPEHVLDLVKKKRKLRKIFQKSQSQEHKKVLNAINNKIKNALKKIKSAKIKTEFSELSQFNQSSSKHWALLNKLENGSTPNTDQITLSLNNESISDNRKVAEIFAESLEEIFSDKDTPIFENRPVPSKTRFSTFEYISTKEIYDSIKSLKNKASAGFDEISNKVVKNLPFNVLKALHSIFNYSIKLGSVPDSWKISKIIMLSKKKKPPDLVTSYRPISILSCLGKLLEKIVNTKIQTWTEENNILPDCQCGFRKKKSTQDQILRLTQSICDGFNKGLLTGAVFFDVKQAFDKTSHSGIINRLNEINFSELLTKWISDFLSNRFFQVSINNHLSSTKPIKCGVPQGSSISPTLFILYFSNVVNNLPKHIKVAIFADDLCIWITCKSTRLIEENLQPAINKIIEFCNTWGFTINVSKTCYTTFTTAGHRKNYHIKYKLKLTILNQDIPIDPFPTFLGIKLDPKLSFKPHLIELENKLTSKTNLIRRIKNFRWSNSLSINIMLYKSLIRSLFDYCFVILNNGTEKISSSLQKIQNKILRIIKYFPYKTSIRTIHKVLKLETIEERANNLFLKFLTNKSKQSLIAKEIEI